MLFIILVEFKKSKQNAGVLCAFVLSPPAFWGPRRDQSKAKQSSLIIKSGFENFGVFMWKSAICRRRAASYSRARPVVNRLDSKSPPPLAEPDAYNRNFVA
jgi:hypothetical protein